MSTARTLGNIGDAVTSSVNSSNVIVAGNVAISGTTTVGGTAVVAVAPSTASNVIFTTDGTTWSSTAKLVIGTAQTTTGGAAVEFAGIPSWVKRVTMMLNGVSTGGSSSLQLQIGTGGNFKDYGYTSGAWTANTNNSTTITSGFILTATNAATTAYFGNIVITNFGSNIWVESHSLGAPVGAYSCIGGGSVSLGGTLDRIRITTLNGVSPDIFDAGSINILYE